MSVINKKPFIKTVLESLSAEQLSTLSNLINGLGDGPVFRSLVSQSPSLLTTSDKGIKRIKLEVALNRDQSIYTGYLIYTDDICAVIAYSSEENQELLLINIEKENGLWKHSFINYDFSILELRSELENASESGSGSVEVKASDIDSESATSGQVLMANGLGGAIWEDTGDVISKITMEYDESDDITHIVFPKGIVPLSFKFDTDGNNSYFLDFIIVDDHGTKTYDIDDVYMQDDCLQLYIVGNISNKVFAQLSYILCQNDVDYLRDTYHLYYPIPEGCAKLYQHYIVLGRPDQTMTELIFYSTEPTAYKKTSFSGTAEKMEAILNKILCIRNRRDTFQSMFVSGSGSNWYVYCQEIRFDSTAATIADAIKQYSFKLSNSTAFTDYVTEF